MELPRYDTLASTLSGRPGLFAVLLFAGLFAYLGCYRAVTSPPGDFADYYTAARLAVNGTLNKVDVYRYLPFEKSVAEYFRETLSSFVPDPPSTALIFIPLAWLPPEAARLAFMLLNMLGAVFLAGILVRLTRLPVVTVAAIVLLNGISLWSDVRDGQVYLLLTLLIATALVLEKEGKRFAAGLLLGAAMPVKYFTALFVVYFLFRKRYRLVTAAALAALAVFTAGVVLGGARLNEYYLSVILPQHLGGNIQNPFSVHFQSFNSLFNRIFIHNTTLNTHPFIDAPFLGLWLRALVPLLALSLVIGAVFATRTLPERERTMYSIASLALFGLAVSPASASYHMTLLIIPMAFLFGLAGEDNQSAGTAWISKRLPLMFTLYLAINLVPFYRLYGLEGDLPLLLLKYSRLFLLAALFVVAIPPSSVEANVFRGFAGIAVALSLVAGYVRLPRSGGGDGAQWAGVGGLIIPRLYSRHGAIRYLRDTPHGYVGRRLASAEDPAETEAPDGSASFELTAFDSTVHDSSEIFLLDKRTGVVSQLTGQGLHNTDPVWNANHSRLYFLSDRGRGVGCTTIFYFPSRRLQPAGISKQEPR